MPGIKDRVSIIGMGCTKFGELWDKSIEDLIVEAVYEAFDDAGIGPDDIQAAWFGTVYSGLTAVTLAKALKLRYIPITRVENMCATGTEALRAAAYAIAAGIYDIALVVGVEKLKDTGWTGVSSANVVSQSMISSSNTEPDITAPSMFAMLANRYFYVYKISPDEGKRLLAHIVVKNHHNGALNPKAHFRREVTIDDVLSSPIVAWPLGILDSCGVSDGAAAAILTRSDLARSFREDPIDIKALAICTGDSRPTLTTDYDFTHVEENFLAAQMAYEEAGIKNPRKEISIAEVHDCFSIHEMLIYEDLQFSARGKARIDIESGAFTLDGDLPINTDGGLKSFGHPIGASGLRMIYEVYKQLQGKCGPRQIKNPTLGLTHNLGGSIGIGNVASVCILGRRD